MSHAVTDPAIIPSGKAGGQSPVQAEDVPVIKSVRARGTWKGSMTTDLSVRGFELRTDEPLPVGGTDSAPSPMELVAAALNGCITVVIETVAAELGVALESVETSSVAHMDVRGFRGTADVSPHFVDYALRLQIVASASHQERQRLQASVEHRCPALNLVRDAGVALEIDWDWSGPTA
jgi:uncharacterized OsmC-like protein